MVSWQQFSHQVFNRVTRTGRTRRTALIYLLLNLWGILSLHPHLLIPEILVVNLTYGKNVTKTENFDISLELTMWKVYFNLAAERILNNVKSFACFFSFPSSISRGGGEESVQKWIGFCDWQFVLRKQIPCSRGRTGFCLCQQNSPHVNRSLLRQKERQMDVSSIFCASATLEGKASRPNTHQRHIQDFFLSQQKYSTNLTCLN